LSLEWLSDFSVPHYKAKYQINYWKEKIPMEYYVVQNDDGRYYKEIYGIGHAWVAKKKDATLYDFDTAVYVARNRGAFIVIAGER
jgi:signal peptidase I